MSILETNNNFHNLFKQETIKDHDCSSYLKQVQKSLETILKCLMDQYSEFQKTYQSEIAHLNTLIQQKDKQICQLKGSKCNHKNMGMIKKKRSFTPIRALSIDDDNIQPTNTSMFNYENNLTPIKSANEQSIHITLNIKQKLQEINQSLFNQVKVGTNLLKDTTGSLQLPIQQAKCGQANSQKIDISKQFQKINLNYDHAQISNQRNLLEKYVSPRNMLSLKNLNVSMSNQYQSKNQGEINKSLVSMNKTMKVQCFKADDDSKDKYESKQNLYQLMKSKGCQKIHRKPGVNGKKTFIQRRRNYTEQLSMKQTNSKEGANNYLLNVPMKKSYTLNSPIR